jgi:hypothetical protein
MRAGAEVRAGDMRTGAFMRAGAECVIEGLMRMGVLRTVPA